MISRRSMVVKALIVCGGLLLLSPAALAEKTTLTVLLYDTRNQAEDKDAVARFMHDHPDVDVQIIWGGTLDKFRTMLAGGLAPDVITTDVGANVTSLAASGAILDLSAYTKAHQAHFQNWFPSILPLGASGGKQWAIPRQGLNTYLMYYNKDLFAQAGLDDPTDAWTWETFRTDARKLTVDTNGDNRFERYAYDYDWQSWRSWLANAGSRMFDDTGHTVTFDSPETRQGLNFLYELRWVDDVIPQPGQQAGRARSRFAQGTLAMVQRSGIFWTESLQGSEIRPGVVLEPLGPAPSRKVMATVQAFLIPSASQHPDSAFELIQYLTDENAARIAVKEGNIPNDTAVARSGFGEGVTIDNFKQEFIESVNYELILGVPAYPYDQLLNAINESIMNNKMSVEQALHTYVPLAQKALDTFWSKS